MMNLRLKLRDRIGFHEPVGPSFKSAKTWRFSIEGTEIEFKAPKHHPMIKSDKAVKPRKHYRYENDYNLIFRSQNTGVVVADDWEHVSLFYHDWAFNGDWFLGCLADVSMSINIYKNKKTDNNISFFHPRAFEQTVGDYLTNRYSKKWEGKHEYITPVNWHVPSGRRW